MRQKNPFIVTEMPLEARFHPSLPFFVTAPFRTKNIHCGEYATRIEAKRRAKALYRRLRLAGVYSASKAEHKAKMLARLEALKD